MMAERMTVKGSDYYDRPTPQMMLDAVASAYAGTKWDQQ